MRVVRIGIASGLGGVVSRVVFERRKRLPAVEIECRDVFSSFQNDALRKGEIDVGFLRPPLDQLNLDCALLFEEEFVVVLARTHRLAKRRFLRLKEIADEPLIIFDRNFSTGLYDKILGLYSRRGMTPHLTVTHAEAHEEAGAIMVASGKAIFMGAGAIVNRSVSGLDLVPSGWMNQKPRSRCTWLGGKTNNPPRRFLSSMPRAASSGPWRIRILHSFGRA